MGELMFSEETFQKALQLHRSGDFDTAEILYQQLLSDNPKHEDTLHLLSILYGQQDKLQDALRYIKQAIALAPNSATFYNTFANIERRMGNMDAAVLHYQKSLTLAPTSAATHNNLGVLYDTLAEVDNAIIYYRKAISLKPDYADASYNLGNALTKQGKFEEAIEVLEKALKYQPQHAQIHAHLGQLFLRLSQYDKAIKHCRTCLELDPDHTEVHHQLAVALTHEDQYEEAVTYYRETLKRDTHHVEALHNLGALYLVKRESDLALTCYLRLLLINPDIDTYYNLGVIYFYQDKHEDAINYFLKVLEFEPNHFNAHLNLGACYIKKEHLDKAAEHYEMALSLKPDDPEILYILAALKQKNLPNTTPQIYIENLFNQYAPHFDQHLTKYLDYRVPTLLSKAVTNFIGAKDADWDILDLGCGTGLCGQSFRVFAKKMIGVDVSEKMLAAAKEKNIYDVLERIDIHLAIKKYAPVDLILAGDVLGYVGDLTELFALTKDALKPNGLFAFTVEKGVGNDFKLQNNARFAHSKSYIKRLAAENGFTVVCEENAILRMQKQEKVEGYVFLVTL
ncbi:MAG: tetratricopeptide repeat protein/methyltransferase [Gammaproteobacteria bacterium]|jgi:predicted TPR repeat methyltransferase|nr:tetratricopeptide repeat protein/methyltransferase [Gammaproteobacteria bacterium]